jgi:hypothetical protein
MQIMKDLAAREELEAKTRLRGQSSRPTAETAVAAIDRSFLKRQGRGNV